MEAETVEFTVTAQELETLLAQSRAKLDDLARDICTVDAELDALATERKQHLLLQSACDTLNELGESGGAELFWGRAIPAGARDEHMRRVRSRVDAFQKRVSEIEDRRQALLQQMRQQQDQTDLLEDEAFEAQEEEEKRRNEWIVEREIDAIRNREPLMPWTRGGEDDRRFRKSLGIALLISVLFALILPFIDLPLHVLQDKAEVPERVVTMMMETHPLPPTPPVEVKPPERVAQQKPVEKPEPQRAAKPDKQAPKPSDAPEPEQGILAFREKLESFKEVPVVARLGAQARINADDSSARPERSMLTTNAPGSSGGIKLAALSRGFGGNGGNERGAIQGAALTRASSSINAIAPAERPLSGGPGLSRTDEEIQIVFDRYKAALYRLYNRELRRDPTLQGKMILRLTIEPDGTVSFCQLQSTDMNAPDLSAQVVDRVRAFNFGAKEVPAITIVYPIDFLPAA
jgi:outer membrane biosynthesis protein TonB